MRVERRRLVVVVVVSLVLVAAIWLLFFRGSDEERVRAAIVRMAAAVRVDPAETNPIVRNARIKGELQEVSTQDVRFEIPELTDLHEGRGRLADVATQASLVYATAEVTMSELRVELDPAMRSASVTATATLTGARHGGVVERDRRHVTFHLRDDGGWRVDELRVSPRQE